MSPHSRRTIPPKVTHKQRSETYGTEFTHQKAGDLERLGCHFCGIYPLLDRSRALGACSRARFVFSAGRDTSNLVGNGCLAKTFNLAVLYRGFDGRLVNLLYLITRWLPAPFGHGPEAVEAIDIACKLCEVIGMVTIAIVIRQGMTLNTSHRIAWRALIAIALFSIIAGFVTYGTARAAEPIFPLLSVPVQEHHHEEAAPTNQHHH